jgi:hypothetical protein
VSDHTILATPPSNLDEDELSDALVVAPPSARATRVTRVLAALLLVAVGATGATWWAQRDGGDAARLTSFGAGGLPSGFPGAAGLGTTGTGTPGSSGADTSSDATTGEVVLVDGAKVYVRTPSGATVTVTTTDDTEVTRSAPSSVVQLQKGDTVSVTGTTTSGGVAATAITAS